MSVTIPLGCIDPTAGGILARTLEQKGGKSAEMEIGQRHIMMCAACRTQLMKLWQQKHGLNTESERATD